MIFRGRDRVCTSTKIIFQCFLTLHSVCAVKMIQKQDHDLEDDALPANQVVDSLADEKKSDNSPTTSVEQHELESGSDTLPHPADVKRAFWLSTIIILVIAVVIPIPLGASTYIFSPRFFTAWMVVAMASVELSQLAYSS